MIKKTICFECPICHKKFEGANLHEDELGNAYVDHVINEFNDLAYELKRDGFTFSVDMFRDRLTLKHLLYKEADIADLSYSKFGCRF